MTTTCLARSVSVDGGFGWFWRQLRRASFSGASCFQIVKVLPLCARSGTAQGLLERRGLPRVDSDNLNFRTAAQHSTVKDSHRFSWHIGSKKVSISRSMCDSLVTSNARHEAFLKPNGEADPLCTYWAVYFSALSPGKSWKECESVWKWYSIQCTQYFFLWHPVALCG